VQHRNVLAVEDYRALCPVSFGGVNAELIRAAEHDLARFAEFDFLPRILRHIESDVNRDAAALGLGEQLGHPLQHGHGLLFKLRIGRASLLRPPWDAHQQQREGPTPTRPLPFLGCTERAHGEPDCVCTSVNTRIMNASNSSSEWKRATWYDARCSTRPS
jgi:hypothetical protein